MQSERLFGQQAALQMSVAIDDVRQVHGDGWLVRGPCALFMILAAPPSQRRSSNGNQCEDERLLPVPNRVDGQECPSCERPLCELPACRIAGSIIDNSSSRGTIPLVGRCDVAIGLRGTVDS